MKQKKSLGQNFLKSLAIVRRIASAADVDSSDTVLEIGPGKGILTKAILERGARVVAVEKDDSLIEYLEDKFSEEIKNKKFFLIHGDILDLSAKEIFSDYKPSPISYKLIANIPYYITGEIIRKFLEEKNSPQSMTLLVQREVAKRIVAADKKESILSLSVKAYGTPRYIETVKRSMFTPAPNVDSAVILIDNISKETFKKRNILPQDFFDVVKKGFAHKRKKLSGNLKESAANKNVLEKFKDCRAEDLTLEEWLDLSTKNN